MSTVATDRERHRPKANSLDRFLRAANDILGDDTNAESTGAGPRHTDWNDEEMAVGHTAASMFSPPASAIKSPGGSSSQSSDGSGPSLSQSPQARSSLDVSAPTDITASALYARIKFIVATGDAATLTKRSVRQALALEYGGDFVKWNKAEINRCATVFVSASIHVRYSLTSTPCNVLSIHTG
jgi:hypothetical protein